MDYVISADESETIEVAIKTMDWAGEITDLFHYGNKEAIHQAVQNLRTRYNGEYHTPGAIGSTGSTLSLEMLLQDGNNGAASTLSTTDADTCCPAPACKHDPKDAEHRS
jgi:hypothetical protein